jgi:putative transposase
MSKFKKSSHAIYQCKYHIVWCPKYRYRILTGNVALFIEKELRKLCEWKKCEIFELAIMPDHIHIIIDIPPKNSVSEILGILKWKTAIKILKIFQELRKKTYWGNHFWSRGYCVSTICIDEEKIRKYVKYQEDNERKEEEDQRGTSLF